MDALDWLLTRVIFGLLTTLSVRTRQIRFSDSIRSQEQRFIGFLLTRGTWLDLPTMVQIYGFVHITSRMDEYIRFKSQMVQFWTA
ncbi:hypothetical protein ES703_71082 [subsurface metagenome]